MRISQSELTKMQTLLEAQDPVFLDLLQLLFTRKIEFLLAELSLMQSVNFRLVVKDAFTHVRRHGLSDFTACPQEFTKLTHDCHTVLDHHILRDLLLQVTRKSLTDDRVDILKQKMDDPEYKIESTVFSEACFDYVMDSSFFSLDMLINHLKEFNDIPFASAAV